jgi:predicted transcriptional regulator
MKKNLAISIYFSEDQKKEIQRLADKIHISRHAFLKYAVLYFVNEFKENPKILKKEKKPVIQFPEI